MAETADREVRDLRKFQATLTSLKLDVDNARARLHVFPGVDDAEALLIDEATSLKTAMELLIPDFDPSDNPPISLSETLYLFEGPFQDKGDHQVEAYDDPPDGWLHYFLYTYYETPAGNLMAPPEMHTEKEKFEWVQGRGYFAQGQYFSTINEFEVTSILRENRAWQGVPNPTVATELQGHIDAITSLRERNHGVESNLTPRADITTVTGSVGFPVAIFNGERLPRTVAERQPTSLVGWTRTLTDGEMVDDFLAIVLGIRDAEHARVFLWQADSMSMIEPTTTTYVQFKVMLALADPQPARLQVIEHPPALTVIREREQHLREGKRRRVDTEALYKLGASFAGTSLEVHRLIDGSGLIIVDANTGEANCEHVHPITLEELVGEQRQMGKACPHC